MVKNLILVFIGGGLGSMLKIFDFKNKLFKFLNFPLGTLFVQSSKWVLFLIGLIIGYGIQKTTT